MLRIYTENHPIFRTLNAMSAYPTNPMRGVGVLGHCVILV